jgi:hypothetical protein
VCLARLNIQLLRLTAGLNGHSQIIVIAQSDMVGQYAVYIIEWFLEILVENMRIVLTMANVALEENK